MRFNRNVAGGVLAAFGLVGAVTVLPALAETNEVIQLDPEVAAALAVNPTIPPSSTAPSSTALSSTASTTTAVPETTTAAPPPSIITSTTAAPATTTSTTSAPETSTSTTAVPDTTTTSTTTSTPVTPETTVPETTTTAAPETTVPPTTQPPTTVAAAREVVDPITAAERSIRSLAQQNNATVNEERFELLVATEIFRLTNCARTGNNTNWCQPGDGTNWFVTQAERNPDGVALLPLTRSGVLDADSAAWSEYLVSFSDIFHSDGSAVIYGENLAYNPSLRDGFTFDVATAADTAATLMQQWMDSPGHRTQILWPHYETFGSGAEIEVSDPSPSTFVETWGTQRFQ